MLPEKLRHSYELYLEEFRCICETSTCLILTRRCSVVWVELPKMTNLSLMQRLRVCGYSSVLRGSGWNMTGVHFWLPFLKANEFPDNKMVGQSRRVGDWEVISRLLLGADGAAADCDDSRPIAAEENISLETAHLKGSGPSLTLYSLTCVYVVWECVFISLRIREEK